MSLNEEDDWERQVDLTAVFLAVRNIRSSEWFSSNFHEDWTKSIMTMPIMTSPVTTALCSLSMQSTVVKDC